MVFSIMLALFLPIFVVSSRGGEVILLALAPQPPDASPSLADAVQAFNARAAKNPIGKDQPPLTEEEVIAAIRWSALFREKLPVTDTEFDAFRNIAETRTLPKGSVLEVLTGFEPNDRMAFEKWSVRLRMPREESGGTYGFIIRDQMIRSRLFGEEERNVIHEWQKKWMKQGLSSFELPVYNRERARAAEADRSKAPP